MTTDKEILMWKNRAAEAERNRMAAENRALKLQSQNDTARRALAEAAAIFDKLWKNEFFDHMGFLVDHDRRTKFSKSEFRHAANLMRGARAGMEQPMELGVQAKKLPELKKGKPDRPRTNDYYMDENGNLHWYYLGRWHAGRTNE